MAKTVTKWQQGKKVVITSKNPLIQLTRKEKGRKNLNS